jgi:hypothetical protein
MSDPQAIWRAKTDDELLDAAEDLSEYTEEGERIIRAELRRRGLPLPDRPIGVCGRCGRSIPRNASNDECGQCGEPYPPDILRALGAAAATEASGDLRTAKTAAGESLTLTWELVPCHGVDFTLRRTRVPGGWLVASDNGALIFVPDVEHRWNENSI